MNHTLALLLAAAVAALLVTIPKLRMFLLIAGIVVLAGVVFGQAAWVAVSPALHHLLAMGGVR